LYRNSTHARTGLKKNFSHVRRRLLDERTMNMAKIARYSGFKMGLIFYDGFYNPIVKKMTETSTEWESEHVRMMYSDKMAAPEPQTRVKMISLIVDSKGSVLEQRQIWVPLIEGGVMPESVLLGLIHAERYQRADKRRFQLADIQTFFVKTTAQETLDLARTAAAGAGPTLNALPPVPVDVVVPPSIFIFHRINCVFLIFREEVRVAAAAARSNKQPPLAVSILKTAGGTTNKNKKQVRISQELPRYKDLLKPRKTIKIHFD
jgi:hypothetical protein